MSHMREKLRQHYLLLFKQLHKINICDLLVKSLPFLFARAIRNLVTDFLRFGEQFMKLFDEDYVQLHQFVLFELVGFRVDSIYIKN